MNTKHWLQYIIYLVIAIGCILALTAAVVPHYAHHKLWFSVLAVGVLPYLVFFVTTQINPHTKLIVAGLAMLSTDGAVKLFERLVNFDYYANGLIYYVPLIITVAIVAIFLYGRPRPIVPIREASNKDIKNSSSGG